MKERQGPFLTVAVKTLQIDHADRLIDQMLTQYIQQASLASFPQSCDKHMLVTLDCTSDCIQHHIAAKEEPFINESVLRVEQIVFGSVVPFKFGEKESDPSIGERRSKCAKR